MQGSFEKDVQRKMEELRLTPSAPVWEKIEIEISTEKKRRRVILWLLPLGLLLAGGGWWLSQSTAEKHPLAEKSPVPQLRETVPSAQSQTTREESSPVSMRPGTFSKDSVHHFQTPSLKSTEPVSSQSSRTVNTVVAIDKTQQNRLLQQEKTAAALSTHITNPKEEVSAFTPSTTEPRAAQTTPSFPITSMDGKATTQLSFEKKDSVNLDTSTSAKSVPAVTDTVQKKKVAAAHKWRKQITVSAGWSSYAEGSNTKSLVASNQFNTPTSVTGSVVSSAPSAVKAGPGFALGFSVAKDLSKHWEIAAGLQYTYASTQQKVGDRKGADTTVRFAQDQTKAEGYYTNTGKNNYTNNFHIIEVPVSLTYKTAGSIPVCFSVGAAYGRLLSTNALTFSSSSNLYYQNTSNNNQNLLPVFSSAEVELFAKKRLSLRTGPFVHYNLLKLQKESSGTSQHLLFAGLKSSLIF